MFYDNEGRMVRPAGQAKVNGPAPVPKSQGHGSFLAGSVPDTEFSIFTPTQYLQSMTPQLTCEQYLRLTRAQRMETVAIRYLVGPTNGASYAFPQIRYFRSGSEPPPGLRVFGSLTHDEQTFVLGIVSWLDSACLSVAARNVARQIAEATAPSPGLGGPSAAKYAPKPGGQAEKYPDKVPGFPPAYEHLRFSTQRFLAMVGFTCERWLAMSRAQRMEAYAAFVASRPGWIPTLTPEEVLVVRNTLRENGGGGEMVPLPPRSNLSLFPALSADDQRTGLIAIAIIDAECVRSETVRIRTSIALQTAPSPGPYDHGKYYAPSPVPLGAKYFAPKPGGEIAPAGCGCDDASYAPFPWAGALAGR